MYKWMTFSLIVYIDFSIESVKIPLVGLDFVNRSKFLYQLILSIILHLSNFSNNFLGEKF